MSVNRESQWAEVIDYIDQYWPRLIRENKQDTETLLAVAHPYMVPTDVVTNGFTFNEEYYWDLYFMFLGLTDTIYEEMIVDMTKNLAQLFKRFGLIPNANRAYFTSRSQPPFFTRMVWLSYESLKKKNDPEADSFLKEMMLVAEEEHLNVWLGIKQPHLRLVHRGLSRYWDINALDELLACESGWDHTTRCDKKRWRFHLPICLNSILYYREMDMAKAFSLMGLNDKAQRWSDAAGARAQTMRELMWDPRKKLFCDYDYERLKCNPDPSLAAFYPLWAGIASKEQASQMIERWLPRFEFEGGLVTTLKQAQGYQWAYPNGWAPLQWLTVAGLERYGFNKEADRIRRKWCDLCTSVFFDTGKMWEKYNVTSLSAKGEAGVYGQLPGFGWTFGVFKDFAKHLSGQQMGHKDMLCQAQIDVG